MEVAMARSITKYDVLFLCLVLIAIIVNKHVSHLSLPLFLVLVLIGLFFEIVTRSFWTYSEEFKRSIFVIENTDVSVAAAFSWAGLLTLCINVSSVLAKALAVPWSELWASIVVVGVFGNAIETACVRWGMFTYEESWITRMFFFKKSVFLWDVPVSVRLGYFLNFGPVCAVILHWSKWI